MYIYVRMLAGDKTVLQYTDNYLEGTEVNTDSILSLCYDIGRCQAPQHKTQVTSL